MVTKEQFTKTVNDLGENSDFFDPVHLGENFWPTSKEMVEEDMVEYEVVEAGLVTTDELYEIIHFLEFYSDVDLMAWGSRSNPGDHAGLIEGWWEMYSTDYQSQSNIIDEITDEVDSGEAHLLTRNELVEFVEWLIMSEEPEESGSDINEVVTRAMEESTINQYSKAWIQKVAKQFFVKKGYEA